MSAAVGRLIALALILALCGPLTIAGETPEEDVGGSSEDALVEEQSPGEDPVVEEATDDGSAKEGEESAASADESEVKPGEKKMTFKPPQLTEAEEKEVFLPDSMKCDGCQAVATQWNRTFARAHLHKTGEWRLDEGEVMMMMEATCDMRTFEVYGISRTESGVNRLKGPGVYSESGVVQMGGRTSFRLSEMCKMILGGLEEYDIYQRWISDMADEVDQPLKAFLCKEENSYCDNDPWGDFLSKPLKDDGFDKFIMAQKEKDEDGKNEDGEDGKKKKKKKKKGGKKKKNKKGKQKKKNKKDEL